MAVVWSILKEDFEELHKRTGLSKKQFFEEFNLKFSEVSHNQYKNSLNVVYMPLRTSTKLSEEILHKNILVLTLDYGKIHLIEL